MLRIHITSDNLSDKELKEWARHNMKCYNKVCPPRTTCSECAFDRGTNQYMIIGADHNPKAKLTKPQMVHHCKWSKCNYGSSAYDCMFMVDGTCQLDYHCPADLPEKAGDK